MIQVVQKSGYVSEAPIPMTAERDHGLSSRKKASDRLASTGPFHPFVSHFPLKPQHLFFLRLHLKERLEVESGVIGIGDN